MLNTLRASLPCISRISHKAHAALVAAIGLRPRAIGVVAAGLMLLVALGESASASNPACFGAAARNAAHPCSNPHLRLSVVPTPGEAQITPNAPCTPIEPRVNVCEFGAPAASATGTIGLVGNSHAGHWRAALQVVAQSLHLQGQSITRSSCPFMLATISLPEPKRAQCTEWNHGVVNWFGQHPEVSTVFVSDQPTPPVVSAGHSVLAA
jgi:hypothetical protein